MIYSKVKDLRIRNNYIVSEYNIIVKKFLFINLMNKINKDQMKFLVFFIKNFKENNNLKTRITNKCVYTLRSKGVSRPFKISRSNLKELMSFGIIPGYFKAAW